MRNFISLLPSPPARLTLLRKWYEAHNSPVDEPVPFAPYLVAGISQRKKAVVVAPVVIRLALNDVYEITFSSHAPHSSRASAKARSAGSFCVVLMAASLGSWRGLRGGRLGRGLAPS